MKPNHADQKEAPPHPRSTPDANAPLCQRPFISSVERGQPCPRVQNLNPNQRVIAQRSSHPKSNCIRPDPGESDQFQSKKFPGYLIGSPLCLRASVVQPPASFRVFLRCHGGLRLRGSNLWRSRIRVNQGQSRLNKEKSNFPFLPSRKPQNSRHLAHTAPSTRWEQTWERGTCTMHRLAPFSPRENWHAELRLSAGQMRGEERLVNPSIPSRRNVSFPLFHPCPLAAPKHSAGGSVV